jgi:hypothetical protein
MNGSKLIAAAIAAVACLSSPSSFAKDSSALTCGKITGTRTEAEFKSVPGQGIYTLNVSFIVKRPAVKDIDHALRECLAMAVKQDGSKDILVTPWFRRSEKDKPNDDTMLNPYGSLTNLIYEASTKSIKIHKLELKRKS